MDHMLVKSWIFDTQLVYLEDFCKNKKNIKYG